jgi:regulator of nucleoside diphosphate kinase
MSDKRIYITETDLQGLRSLLKPAHLPNPPDADLRSKLEDAVVLEEDKMPSDVVTMNSRFLLRDVDADVTSEYTLVYPRKADFSRGRLNVLAPVGQAVLGGRELDAVDWPAPAGRKRFQILEVVYQPEAAARVEDAAV